MATTFEILTATVGQLENLGKLVVTLINTHVEDQRTVEKIKADAETVKANAAEAIANAAKATEEANAIKATDAQSAELATRFSNVVDQLIAQAAAALPPEQPTEPPTPPAV